MDTYVTYNGITERIEIDESLNDIAVYAQMIRDKFDLLIEDEIIFEEDFEIKGLYEGIIVPIRINLYMIDNPKGNISNINRVRSLNLELPLKMHINDKNIDTFPNLESLKIYDSSVTNVGVLKLKDQLTSLNLIHSCNNITDECLSKMHKLESLYIGYDFGISKTRTINNLPNLKELYIYTEDSFSPGSIIDLKNIRHLKCINSTVTYINPQNLESLSISDLRNFPLCDLTSNLKSLTLSNWIYNYSGIPPDIASGIESLTVHGMIEGIEDYTNLKIFNIYSRFGNWDKLNWDKLEELGIWKNTVFPPKEKCKQYNISINTTNTKIAFDGYPRVSYTSED